MFGKFKKIISEQNFIQKCTLCRKLNRIFNFFLPEKIKRRRSYYEMKKIVVYLHLIQNFW